MHKYLTVCILYLFVEGEHVSWDRICRSEVPTLFCGKDIRQSLETFLVHVDNTFHQILLDTHALNSFRVVYQVTHFGKLASLSTFQQADGGSFFASSSRSATSMHISFGKAGHIVIDNCADLFNIHTS